MTEAVEQKVDRATGRGEFWREFVVPTAKGLEAFCWRVTVRGLVIYLLFRSLCPSTGNVTALKATATTTVPAMAPRIVNPAVLSEISNED